MLTVGAPPEPARADEYDDRRSENESRQEAVDETMSTPRRSSPTPTPHLVQAYAEHQALDAAIPVAEAEPVAAEAELT